MRTTWVTVATGILLGISGSAQPPTRSIAVTRVNVIDATGAPLKRDMTVIIDEGTISAVVPAAAARLPANAQVVDGSGKFLIPGLWDMHVHWYDERLLPLFIANGVTGVRQMWGFPMHLDWRTRVKNRALLAPRLSIASPIVDGPNPVWRSSTVVRDAEESRAAVRKIKDAGFDFVKVYERLPRDAYFAIAEETRTLGIPFAGHVPQAISAIEASTAGQRSIEHLSGVLLGASTEGDQIRARRMALLKDQETSKAIDPATRVALRQLTERVLATYDDKKAAALFGAFVKNGTWQCPTLVVNRSMAMLDDAAFIADARLKYMPAAIRDSWLPKNDFRLQTKGPADWATDRRMFRKEMEVVGAMNRAGVKIIAGTDVLNPFAFPGFSLHDELALLVEAGLTPMAALQAASANAAAYLGQSASAGTIESGKTADLVLLDANPLENITNTTHIASVIFDGRVLPRRELDAMLADAERVANLKPISEALLRTIDEKGVDAAVAQYRDLKAREPEAYDFTEDELNTLGYRLLKNKRVDEAIEIFRLNAETFQKSGSAFDSLGEAYMIKGDRDRAIENYKRALERDPTNSNAIAMLKKLGGS